jgi:hypothetical protein
VAAQTAVAMAEESGEGRAQEAARERRARLPGDPVGDRAATVGGRLDRALVFPEALGEHPRALEEAAAAVDPLEDEIVVVDRHQAEEQDPAAPEASRLDRGQVKAVEAARTVIRSRGASSSLIPATLITRSQTASGAAGSEETTLSSARRRI